MTSNILNILLTFLSVIEIKYTHFNKLNTDIKVVTNQLKFIFLNENN